MNASGSSNDIRDELPRVSVDSINEWQRIQSSLNDELLSVFHERVLGSSMETDKENILLHLQQFLHRTFQIAKPNLRVNGKNFDEYDEDEQDTDQFDEALDRKVWSLSDQRLKWDLEVALKRRNTPNDVETLMRDVIQTQRNADSAAPSSKSIEWDEEMVGDDNGREQEAGDLALDVISTLHEDVMDQFERGERLKEVEAEVRRLKT